MTKLTLPPVVGQRYYYQNTEDGNDDEWYLCTITEAARFEGDVVYHSEDKRNDNWVYWPDGEAKVNPGTDDEYHVAILVQDAPVSELERLQNERAERMKRLKELGA